MHSLIRIAAIGVLGLAGLTARAEDWPKWMGPRGDGISKETIATKWPEKLKEVWRANVGIGYSSPVAVGGKVYQMATVDDKDVLRCFEAATGKVVWEQSYAGAYSGQYKGARATPMIVGDRIYTYGGNGQLVCRELATGKQIWLTNVLQETSAKNLRWGVASNPTLDGSRIYVQSGDGNAVCVAVDKDSGKIVWKSEAGLGGYAQPVLIDVGSTKQLVVFGGKKVFGLNPQTGKTIWSEVWETSYDVNASNPVYSGGHLFVSSDYGHGCMMLKVTATGATKLWEKKDMKAHFQPVLLDRGHLYGNSEGSLTCMVWPSGVVKWASKEKALLGKGGTLVRIGDGLVALSDRGKLSLIKATPAGHEVISQIDRFVEGTDVWSTPLIYQGKLYAKGKEELVCVEVGK